MNIFSDERAPEILRNRRKISPFGDNFWEIFPDRARLNSRLGTPGFARGYTSSGLSGRKSRHSMPPSAEVAGSRLMAIFAGRQVGCVMATRVAIWQVSRSDCICFVFQRHRMRHMTFYALGNVCFVRMGNIPVRSSSFSTWSLIIGRFFGELIERPVTGEAFLCDGLLFFLFLIRLRSCSRQKRKSSEERHQK